MAAEPGQGTNYPVAAERPLYLSGLLFLLPPLHDDVLRLGRRPLRPLEVDLVLGAVLVVDLALPRRDLDLEGGLLVRH